MMRYVLMLTLTSALCCGAITLTSPNGGQYLPSGSAYSIAWQSTNSSTHTVKIEFSYTNGVSWQTIAVAANSSSGTNTYLWIVPAASSPYCLIRITDNTNIDSLDTSDSVFEVYPCKLALDVNHDCIMNLSELAWLAQQWLACGDPYNSSCAGGNHPPMITSTPITSATALSPYQYDVNATDSDLDTLTYSLEVFPTGMTINNTSGLIGWTPQVDQTGNQAVVVQATDDMDAVNQQSYTIVVSSAISYTNTGAPTGDKPNLRERQVMVWTNMVRMAPIQYRNQYTTYTGILDLYPAVEPLYYQILLNNAARYHAIDMATNGCFQHNSCDGTNWYTRLQSFYPAITSAGENIVAGPTTAKASVDLWLCENPSGSCYADKSGSDGHRANIMSSSFQEIGVGNYSSYTVQDFAGNTPASKPAIVSACHDFIETGKISFFLNYRDTANLTPIQVKVVVDGTPYDMIVNTGTSYTGTYRYDLAKVTSCRTYYFTAITAGGQGWRYPGPGVFQTVGEGSCTEDYIVP